MLDTPGAFGRQADANEAVDALLELERSTGRSSQFSQLDNVVAGVIRHSLAGERVVGFSKDKVKGYQAALTCLTNEEREYVRSVFAVEAQQSRGAWFLPTYGPIRASNLIIPYAFAMNERFPMEIIQGEQGSVELVSDPSVILLWTVLDPLFEILFRPLVLRSGRGLPSPVRPKEAQLKDWAEVDSFYETVGLDLKSELAVMRYGGAWHRLHAAEQQAAKRRLLDAIVRECDALLVAQRYRARRVRALVAAYYKKAKDGKALRTKVLNKTLERTLAGYFGGDWLAFLSYLGEQPHQEEQVVTALPQTQLFTAGSERAAEVAPQLGIPEEEARLVMETFWQAPGGISPVQQRVAFMKEYWWVFNEIHSLQKTGMKPLWGLVDEWAGFSLGRNYESPHQPGLYRELLPAPMIRRIEELWQTRMIPAYPARMVTEAFAHVTMGKAFGPALKFWHGCALTAWFLCEGPYSRTDMQGLANYHARELAALNDLGTLVAPQLFDELIKAERLLGPPEPIYTKQETHTVQGAFTFTMSMSSGSRRAGFERLREIITKHRVQWTQQYLDKYLEALWESEVRKAAQEYEIARRQKNKVPTAQQFARMAEPAINHWFAGNIANLYAAIGERSPVDVNYERIMPQDIEGFAKTIYSTLKARWQEPVDSEEARIELNAIARLAENSVLYVQLEEALRRKPTTKEFGPLRYDSGWSAIAPTIEEAWEKFADLIDNAKLSVNSGPVQKIREVTSQPIQVHAPNTQATPAPRTNVNDVRQQMQAPERMQNLELPASNHPAEQPVTGKRSWLDRLLGKD